MLCFVLALSDNNVATQRQWPLHARVRCTLTTPPGTRSHTHTHTTHTHTRTHTHTHTHTQDRHELHNHLALSWLQTSSDTSHTDLPTYICCVVHVPDIGSTAQETNWYKLPYWHCGDNVSKWLREFVVCNYLSTVHQLKRYSVCTWLHYHSIFPFYANHTVGLLHLLSVCLWGKEGLCGQTTYCPLSQAYVHIPEVLLTCLT